MEVVELAEKNRGNSGTGGARSILTDVQCGEITRHTEVATATYIFLMEDEYNQRDCLSATDYMTMGGTKKSANW